MMLLITKAVPTILRFRDPNLGRLVTPRHYSNLDGMVAAGITWAADNDAYSGFDKPVFEYMLGRLAGLPGCRFVTAPDVVADAAATLQRFCPWSREIRAAGLPVALVAQDGLQRLPVPWDDLDALFVGGSTAWKLSVHAALLVGEANRRGKWTHMGRVNSARRMAWAAAVGCDSVDGTSYVRFTDRHLPAALLQAAAPPQGLLHTSETEVARTARPGTRSMARGSLSLSPASVAESHTSVSDPPRRRWPLQPLEWAAATHPTTTVTVKAGVL